MAADQRFVAAIQGLAKAFGVTLTEGRIEAYAEALADIRIESLEGGARLMIANKLPAPVAWREAASRWEYEELEGMVE